MSHSSAPLLSAIDLGLTLPEGRVLFQGINLSFARERTGLVGPNGVGKTLLLDVLTGRRAATRGHVVRRGRVDYVPQGGGRDLAPARATVADRLRVRTRLDALARVLRGGTDPADLDRIGPDGWDLPERIEGALARFRLDHLPLDRPLDRVSGGEATRLALAAAFLEGPDLLLLDEPSNDLDGRSRGALIEALAGWSGGLVVASHDRTLLRGVDRILELGPRGVAEYGGGYDAYRAMRDAERSAAEAERSEAEAARRKARVEARRVTERQARRSARGKSRRADGGVPKILLNTMRNRSERSTARLGKVMRGVEEEASARLATAQDRMDEIVPPRMEVAPSRVPEGKQVLVLESVSYTPPGSDRPVLTGVDLVLRGPERIGVVGPNGSGKSTLLGIMAGVLTPDTGRVHVGVPSGRVTYLDQSGSGLPPAATVLDCFRAVHPEWDEGFARQILARYLFAGDRALAPVGRLSGGERMRAGLACVLGGAVGPALLLLDEPTNHLDFMSLETVERAVAGYDGALVVVSHDPDFLEAVGVDRVLEMG